MTPMNRYTLGAVYLTCVALFTFLLRAVWRAWIALPYYLTTSFFCNHGVAVSERIRLVSLHFLQYAHLDSHTQPHSVRRMNAEERKKSTQRQTLKHFNISFWIYNNDQVKYYAHSFHLQLLLIDWMIEWLTVVCFTCNKVLMQKKYECWENKLLLLLFIQFIFSIINHQRFC